MSHLAAWVVRVRCGESSTSMTIIGARQCRQMKVGAGDAGAA
ncbi:hypothetical protein [Paraburkholderia sp. DGU8]